MRLLPEVTPEHRLALVSAARTFLGVKFRHRGRSRYCLDCLGLLVVSLQAIGLAPTDREAYGRDPSQDGLRTAVVNHLGPPIPLQSIAPGDIVLMQWHGQPNHVAIVTDNPYGGLGLIHAYSGAGCVVEHALADPWPRRIFEAFRL